MQEFLNNIIPNVMAKLPDFYAAIGDTLLMVVWSGAISFVLGLTLGVLITVTKPGGILENKIVYQILDKLVSLFRSIPFIILLTWVMPVSRAIMGTLRFFLCSLITLAGLRRHSSADDSGNTRDNGADNLSRHVPPAFCYTFA